MDVTALHTPLELIFSIVLGECLAGLKVRESVCEGDEWSCCDRLVSSRVAELPIWNVVPSFLLFGGLVCNRTAVTTAGTKWKWDEV